MLKKLTSKTSERRKKIFEERIALYESCVEWCIFICDKSPGGDMYGDYDLGVDVADPQL